MIYGLNQHYYVLAVSGALAARFEAWHTTVAPPEFSSTDVSQMEPENVNKGG